MISRLPPSPAEVESAVSSLFDVAEAHDLEGCLSALVPIEVEEGGLRRINFVPVVGFYDLHDSVNQLYRLTTFCESKVEHLRLRLLAYCHILEAPFPMAVLWNLMRLLAREPCTWQLMRPTSKGPKPCYYPYQRIELLRGTAENTGSSAAESLANVMGRVWSTTLRNSFLHSEYMWVGTSFNSTTFNSPITRGEKRNRSREIYLTASEVESFWLASDSFLRAFLTRYEDLLGRFETSGPHPVQAGGQIYFDEGTGSWRWWKCKGAVTVTFRSMRRRG